MINKQKVSIIMPYYKKKKYFVKSLKSAINQTYKNKEIIIIYDDKDEDELKFINETVNKFKNVKIIKNSQNIGVGPSRNKGIKLSQGKYIAFLDCDDVWHKTKLEKQISFMKSTNADLSYTSFYIYDTINNVRKIRRVRKNISYEKLSRGCEIGLSTVIARSKIKKFLKFPNLKTQEDFCLWLSLIKKGIKFKSLNTVLGYWYVVPKSLSSDYIQKIQDCFMVFYKYQKMNFLKSIYQVFLVSMNKIFKNS